MDKMRKNKPINSHKDYKNIPDLSHTTSENRPATDGLSKEEDNKASAQISLDRYNAEWSAVLNCFQTNPLLKLSIDGNLRASRFRSIYWRVFLKILGKDVNKWASEVTDHRDLYDKLIHDLQTKPWSSENSSTSDNPLSQEHGSVWCRYFNDEDLRAVIRQDVIRTFPGIDFFRGAEIQDLMVEVLFLYARKTPSLCYRQGMHEVLAPILFVIHCDQEATAHAQEMGSDNQDLAVLFDSKYLAADAFSIFTRVMTNLEFSYCISKSSWNPNSSSENNENELALRLEFIKEKLLRKSDPDLTAYLEKVNIPLQLFGIRWWRLLFGREFPLQDLLMLWDVIFTSDDFHLVDYIVVAMLVAIRDLLIDKEYTSCLSCLMRYPVGVDVTFVIQHALHQLDPKKYPKPPQPATCSPSDRNRPRKKFQQRSIKSLNETANRQQWMAGKPFPVAESGEQEPRPVDGYTLQDPELLRVEVEHLRAVMSLVQIKIKQYREALQDVVYASDDLEAVQALEGLHEICHLMDDPAPSPLPEVPIEPAFEAGEIKNPVPPIVRSNSHDKTRDMQHKKLDVFKHTFGDEVISGAPMADPLEREGKPPPADDWRQFSKELNKMGVN